jgi:hypothetical protein
LRTSTTIFLILVFFAQTFSGYLIAADYYVNPQKFIQNCINKSKPEMKCKGKCQMMKKIKEVEKKNTESGTDEEASSQIVFLFDFPLENSNNYIFNTSHEKFLIYPSNISLSDFIYSVFQPPKV